MNTKLSSVHRLLSLMMLGVVCGIGSTVRADQAGDLDWTPHGAAAPVARGTCVVPWVDQAGQRWILSWLLGGVLMIDADSGQSTHYPLPVSAGSPFHYLITPDHQFYTVLRQGDTSAFMQFDLTARQWHVLGSGPSGFAMSLTWEPGQDVIYAAMYPDSRVLAYHRQTGELVDHGTVNKEDWPQYPGRINMDRSGWLYVAIGNTLSQIAAYHPQTREHRLLFDQADRPQGRAYVHVTADGEVFGYLFHGGPWYRFENGQATPVDEPEPRSTPYRWGWQNRQHHAFGDGSRLEAIDFADRIALIREPGQDQPRAIRFDYQGGGARIYTMLAGEDGHIYAGTGHPVRLARLDRHTGRIEHWGIGGIDGGHINTLVEHKGLIYGAIYSHGYVFVYDPDQPPHGQWQSSDTGPATFSHTPLSNPRLLFDAREQINRPHAMLLTSDERYLLMSGTPGYGRTGGGLLIYDLLMQHGKLMDHQAVVADQSTYAMVNLPDGQVLGGTTTAPGTGGQVVASQAVLYRLNPASGAVTVLGSPVAGAAEIRDLLLADDGLVYGIARMVDPGMIEPGVIWFHTLAGRPVLFVYDPALDQVVHQQDLGAYSQSVRGVQSPGMLLAHGEHVYVACAEQLLRVTKESFAVEPIGRSPVSLDTLMRGPIPDSGRVYFSHGDAIWSLLLER